jgi:SH3-like domain-containing protein
MTWLAAMALLAASSGAVVIRPVANMHSGPSESADIVSQAILGNHVRLIEERGSWIQIRTADQYLGWVAVGALRRLRPGEASYASSGRVAKIESLFANLYQEPDVTKHQPLLTAPFEVQLEITSEPEADNRRWLAVRLPDGRSAWVQRGDLTFDSKPLSIDAMIALAKRFLGFPYLWGGTSSFGCDCSGFTQMLLRQRGVVMPRDAGPQMEWNGLAAVERSVLRPGDLLFFGPSVQKVTHTGMYLGGGEFISATTWLKPVVQISRLDDPHWSSLLVGCRRLK